MWVNRIKDEIGGELEIAEKDLKIENISADLFSADW